MRLVPGAVLLPLDWLRAPTYAPCRVQDEHVAVAALWKPPLVPELWQAPAWLLGPILAGSTQRPSSGSGSSSSGESESSSSSEEESSESESESEGGSSSKAAGDANPSTEPGKQTEQAPAAAQGTAAGVAPGASPASRDGAQQAGPQGSAAQGGPDTAKPLSMFEELDQIFLRGAGRANGGGGHGGPGPRDSRTRMSVLERLRVAQPASLGAAAATAAPTPARAVGDLAAAHCSQAGPLSSARKANGAAVLAATAAAVAAAAAGAKAGSGQRATAAAAAAAAAVPPRRRAPPAGAAAPPSAAAAAGAGAAGAGEEARVYVVGGKPYRQLVGAPGISAWVHDKLSSRARPGSNEVPVGEGGGAPRPPQPAAVLGYLCHVKGTDQLLLVANVHSKGALRQLQGHPALERLRQQSARRVTCAVLCCAVLCWAGLSCPPPWSCLACYGGTGPCLTLGAEPATHGWALLNPSFPVSLQQLGTSQCPWDTGTRQTLEV